MARIRTIKPEFFTSEDVVTMTPLARLLFIALWCEADKEGRLVWKPKTFKLRYLPADRCDVDALCAELVSGGLVVPYGDGLAVIPTFTRHQHINPRESESRLPPPNEADLTRRDASVTRADATVTHREEGKGKEGKGKEGKGREGDTSRHATVDVFEERFWKPYPRKVAKSDALRAWQKATKTTDPETILAGLAAYRWPEDPQFIPYPATWLNGGRWVDEQPPEGHPLGNPNRPARPGKLTIEEQRRADRLAVLEGLGLKVAGDGGTDPGEGGGGDFEDAADLARFVGSGRA